MEDCPDGRMTREKMQIMFSSIIPEGDAGGQFLEQLFRIFDKDGDGSIDFKEFMIATDMTSCGDPEEKLRWAFRMYDKDGSGEIDIDEMVDIFSLMYTVQVSKSFSKTLILHFKFKSSSSLHESGNKETRRKLFVTWY